MTSFASSAEGVQAEVPPRQRKTNSTSRLPCVYKALAEAEKPLTAREIAKTVHCSRVTVRRHLADLGRDGRVEVTGTRPRFDADGRKLPSRRENEYATSSAPTDLRP